jgi:fructose-bisphosphate aldolase class II
MSLVLNYPKAKKLFQHAKANNYALPAVNVTSSNVINATLEAAKTTASPVIIQFSNSGAAFFAGKSLDNSNNHRSSEP